MQQEGGAPAGPQAASAQQEQPGHQGRPRRQATLAAAAAVAAAGGGAGAEPPVDEAAAQAVIREKNRLAQQRFRARQRQQRQHEQQQCGAMQQQIDKLMAENEELRRRGTVFAKVLAVRDAMLHAVATLQPCSDVQRQQGVQPTLSEPAVEAAQGLAKAIGELPSEGEMEAAAGLADIGLQLSSATLRAESAATPGSTSVGDEGEGMGASQPQGPQASQPQGPQASQPQGPQASQPQGPQASQPQGPQASQPQGPQASQPQGPQASQQVDPGVSEQQGSGSMVSTTGIGAHSMRSTLGEQHRSGTALQLDGSALRDVSSIPPPSDQAVVACVEAMTEPAHLLAYFRRWQAELKASYLAADAAGFDADSVAVVEAVTDRMTQVWWHVGQLKPSYLCYLAHATLPENSGQLALWREIAVEVLREMDERSVEMVRLSWHNYSKRLAKIAVGVSRWVKRLQEYAVHSPDGLVTNANRALNLMEITTHMASAAPPWAPPAAARSMEFVAAQFPASSTLLRAYVNFRSSPFLPDVVAIVCNLVTAPSPRACQARVGL